MLHHNLALKPYKMTLLFKLKYTREREREREKSKRKRDVTLSIMLICGQ